MYNMIGYMREIYISHSCQEMRGKTYPQKQLQTLHNICWSVLKQGRRGFEMSSLFHCAFCPVCHPQQQVHIVLLCCLHPMTMLPASSTTQILPFESPRRSPEASSSAPDWYLTHFAGSTTSPSHLSQNLLSYEDFSGFPYLGFALPYLAPTVLPCLSLFCGASYSAAAGLCTAGARVTAAVRGRRGVRASLAAEGRRTSERTAGGMGRAGLQQAKLKSI